ncbi:MAG: hypothetical protein KJS77_04505 [Planctomycetes bacterium]|nr:hypothetical protein [Planctomycetota bacterium]
MDVLDQLADVAVPPVPAQRSFTAGVRRKLNPRLLAVHVIEFALGATAWAVIHMTAALVAAVQYTVTGTWPRGQGPGETRGDAR